MAEHLDMKELDELVFGPGAASAELSRPGQLSRGRTPKAMTIEVIRVLTAEDKEVLLTTPSIVSWPRLNTPTQMRHCHHQLARLLALGKENVEISLITGYTPQYIYEIQKGKDFAELLAYYAKQKEQIFVDVLERMKVLGVTAIEKLQERLEDENETWTKRELMELTEMAVIKGAQGKAGNNGGIPNGGVSIAVSFVSAKIGESPNSAMIDVTPGGQS